MKFAVVCLAFCTLVATLCFVACGEKHADGDAVAEEGLLVVTVTEADVGATLKDAMRVMQSNGELTFTDDGTGMITGINGYAPTGNEFWALYTSCADYVMSGYGIVYDGVTYDSATLGYASLPAIVGETYIWKISTW